MIKRFFSFLGARLWIVVVATAVVNNLLVFFAYPFYGGMDSYSYDVAGLQLLSGEVFDFFPLIYRPPLVPIVKNLLYMVFEGHSYLFCVLLHMLGVFCVWMVYRIGSYYNRWVGFVAAMAIAVNIDVAVMFHSISSLTVFMPLMLAAADRFVRWCKRPLMKDALWLAFWVFLASMARTESVILIPAFFLFGLLSHWKYRQALVFLCLAALAYNLVCYQYYKAFGFWGMTDKTGWSMFIRLSRKADQLFDQADGNAIRELYFQMSEWLPNGETPEAMFASGMLANTDRAPTSRKVDQIKEDVKLLERQMFTLEQAQSDLGYGDADRLFLRASLEAIKQQPGKFIFTSIVRFLAQMGLLSPPEGLTHEEYILGRTQFLRRSISLWNEGGEIEDMKRERWFMPKGWVESPLKWERRVIWKKFLRFIGFNVDVPERPDYFKLRRNYHLNLGHENVDRPEVRSNGIMTERLMHGVDLDNYFYYGFWAPRYYKAYIMAGLEHFRAGHYEKAEEMFDRSLLLNPTNEPLFEAIGANYSHLRMPYKAVKMFERAIAEGTPRIDPYLYVARFYADKGDFERARDVYLQVMGRVEPENYDVPFMFGACLWVTGNKEAARNTLTQLATAAPQDTRAKDFLAFVDVEHQPNELAIAAKLREMVGFEPVDSGIPNEFIDHWKGRIIIEPVWVQQYSLVLLNIWDIFFRSSGDFRVVILLWIIGICLGTYRSWRMILTAFLCVVVFKALTQSVFSDNLGGRFFLAMLPFYWLGACCGFFSIFEYARHNSFDAEMEMTLDRK